MTTYGQALVTIPSKFRVGICPLLSVFAMGGLVFGLSFQNYFYNFGLIMDYGTYFPTDVLDTLIMLSLPASIMLCFVVSQVRVRLNLHWLNMWSIIHTILFFVNFLQTILYILGRPDSVFSFVSSVTSSSSTSALIEFVQSITASAASFIANYNVPGTVGFEIAMYVASYSFMVQFCFCAIFTSMACSLYGETKFIVTMADSQKQFMLHTELRKPKMCCK
uniref:Transmembrane domain-containing protein n=1 Tax=Trepomonas sp. PC1 TaxID=1076344 RepID=A0A146KJC5_9EUKA|eukprot:JAP95369.1 Transmembrane domain-containing protein [Trepomonas sp. PC1]